MARTLSPRVVVALDVAVVVGLTASGLFSRHGWRAWYVALLKGFALIAVPVLGGAGVVTWLCPVTSSKVWGRHLRAMTW
jgi:hypothetical protein